MADSKSSLSTSDNKPNLDNLPELIYFHLFEHLDLDDVCVLKLVSKKLYSIAKEYNVRELYFMPRKYHEDMDHFFNNSWLSTSKSIKFIYHLDLFKLDLLINPSKNLLNLRYLKINYCPAIFDLDALNKFTKLQILELVELEINVDYDLKLPELKALRINFGKNDSGGLEIDTPKLHHLSIDSKFQSKLMNNEIEFKNPLSIKYLSAPQFADSLLAFKSLKCLELNGGGLNINTDILKFDHLKKLKTNSSLTDNEVGELKKLFELSKKDDLVIVLRGVRIKKVNKIDEYVRTSNKLEFQFDNYPALEDDLNYYTRLNYDSLINLMPNYQPPDLFNKFNNVQKITIDSEVRDESRLIKVITKCKNLYHLTDKASLSQQFYDQLPKISSLIKLKIANNIDLNFRFITNMPYLVCFDTDCDVLKDMDLNLNNLKNLKNLKFQVLNNNNKYKLVGVDLEKKSRDSYLICSYYYWNKELPFKKYCTYGDLIKYLDDIRSC